MKFSLKIIVALVLSCVAAFAQSGKPLVQSGNVTPTHVWCVTTNGVAQDCGTAAIPFATTFGTWGTGPTNCAWTALVTSGAAQQICLGGTTSGGAELYVQNYGSAPALPLTFSLNGTKYQFPYTVGGIVGPNPTVVGGVAVWGNTVGSLLADATGSDGHFGSGRPWCEPISHGAIPDGVTNSLAAFNACLTALGGSGGTIWLDQIPGVGFTYCLSAASQAAIFNVNAPIRILSAMPEIVLSSCGSGFSVMEISAPVIADGFYITGPGEDGSSTFGASEPALILASGAGGTKLYNMVISGGSPTIQWNCGECQAYNVNAGFAYANPSSSIAAEWYFQAGGGELFNVSADDNEYPYGIPTPPFTYTAWATNQSVATNAVRVATCQDGQEYVIQAYSGGTTASSGTGPTCKNYGGAAARFTDGTVTWSLSHPFFLYHWQIDTGSTDVHIHRADTGGGYVGFGITNTLSGAAPGSITCIDCNGGDSYHAQVDGKAGSSVIFNDDLFAQCLQTSCSLLNFESTFTGGVSIIGGTATQSPNGITIAGGSNYRIVGVDLTQNTTAIAISGSSANITAVGNNLQAATTGISIANTASDITFTGNVGCISGSTTCVAN